MCIRDVDSATLDIENIKTLAIAFKEHLKTVKSDNAPADFPWYLYDTFANIWHLDSLLTGENRNLFRDLRGQHIADIGAADGDMAFFCESLGASVDIIDNGPTNMNGLRGAEIVKRATGSEVGIHHMNLDEYFSLPGQYDFAFFMGILYHLQNPYYVMSTLAKNVKRIVMSTRTASHAPPKYASLEAGYDEVSLAYLLDSEESNGDDTNYWVFSDAGMRRLISRTGWRILDYKNFGAIEHSDPMTVQGDRRVFCYLESEVFQEK